MYSSAAGAAFTVSDTSRVYIDVNVSEELINRIAVGQSVDVKVSAVSGYAIYGQN